MNIPSRYLALIALLVSVPVSAWAIAYRPMNNAVHSASTEIRDRTIKLTNYNKVNSQYRKMKSISTALEKIKVDVLDRIPTEHKADQWLESASDAAFDLGLLVQSVTTSGNRSDGEYQILPVDMNVSGDYPSIYKLIQHLERMNRVTRIERMSLHRESEEIVEARLIVHLIFGRGQKE